MPTEAVKAPRQLRSHAFGLDLEGDRGIVGLLPSRRPLRGPATLIEIAERGRPPTGGQTGKEVRRVQGLDGAVRLSIHFHEERGYLLSLPGIGTYGVAPDGLHVTCFPEPGIEDWRWQRAVVNQVLPLAATIRGLEMIHAGAVSIDGRVFAMVGHPGAGKSSTTLRLILRGASFFTDDALAIERTDEGLLAHPGAAVSNFPRNERDLMDTGERDRLGKVIGDGDAHKSLLELKREEASLPLGALFFLRRGREGAETGFERVLGADASTLLGSTYVQSVRSPQRLANQLELCATVAHEVPVFDVLIPDSVGANESAAALMAQADTLLHDASP
jgi:hypothetical protein